MTSIDLDAHRPCRAPTHPGALLREDVIPALGISTEAFARAIGVTHRYLRQVLAEDADISKEMAEGLGVFLGNGSGLWLRMQEARTSWTDQTRP